MDVPDSAPSAVRDESLIDLVALGSFVWRLKWAVVLAAAAGLLVAVLYLNLATPKYEASLRITPASSTSGGVGGALGRIGNLAAIAGVQVRQGSEGAAPFELYLDRLRSRDLAVALARNDDIMRTVFESEWDPATRSFRDSPGLLRPLRGLVYGIAGQPVQPWDPPGPARLQEYLATAIRVTPPAPKDPPITTLLIRHRDPAFAKRLLEAVHVQADSDVRAQSLARARQYSAHLAEKLATTDVAEHRRTLSEALLEQQRAVMMATATGAYAAMPTESAVTSRRPVTPQVIVALGLGLILGSVVGLLGLTVAYFVKPRDRPADQRLPARP
jgi:hypothetical protein